jgi:hypothetical protein
LEHLPLYHLEQSFAALNAWPHFDRLVEEIGYPSVCGRGKEEYRLIYLF